MLLGELIMTEKFDFNKALKAMRRLAEGWGEGVSLKIPPSSPPSPPRGRRSKYIQLPES
jgi:hypothetical protein